MSVFQEINRKKANLFWHIIDIVSSNSRFFGELYQKYIGVHYLKEARRFDFSNSSKILHIGSGAYPITAIILASYFNSHVVTIDKNPFVLQIAKKVIKKTHLNDRVSVSNGNGLHVDLSNFDVIIISSCSVPKENILRHIFTTANDGCKIIVRELPLELDELKQFLTKFEEITQLDEIICCAGPNLCWNSLLLQKNLSKKE